MTERPEIFVVLDPTRMLQPALERAESIARVAGARLHLHCSLEQQPGPVTQPPATDPVRRWLERLAAPLREQGVAVTLEVQVSRDWREAVIAAVARRGSNLVVKNASHHSAMGRALLKSADWMLLRHSPCPVLLVKSLRNWTRGKLLAAVKPAPPDDAHATVNEAVIDAARAIAADFELELHVVSVWPEGASVNHEAVAGRCGLSPERLHVGRGRVRESIQAVAGEIGADLVLVGAVRRGDEEGVLAGRTAERLLDALDADLAALPPPAASVLGTAAAG